MTSRSKSPMIGTSKAGTPITEQLAEQLACEAEAGYDLRLGRRAGRRSLAGGPGKSPRLNFRVEPALYAQAAERAERDDKSLSQLAREALELYLAKT